MRGLRKSHFLAGTAAALALAASGGAFATYDTMGPPDETSGIEATVTPAPASSVAAKPEVPAPTAAPAAVFEPAAVASPAPVSEPAPVAPPEPPPPPVFTGRDLIKAPLATTLAEGDVPVAEKLREFLATRADRLFIRKPERAAVEAFYRDRGFAPLWVARDQHNARAKAAAAHLAAADADGLDPADYPVPAAKTGAVADAVVDAELKLTLSVLTYARHAQLGRVHYSRISSDVSYTQIAPDPAEILAKMDASSIGEALAAYNPPHPAYKALKAQLAAARAGKGEAGVVRVDKGPVLKTGMQDERVPQLRARLGVVSESEDTTYDKVLSEAVKKFQSERQIAPSGQLTHATVDALNGPRRDNNVDLIIANMERWRWVPRILGTNHVVVNIPDYSLKVYRDGREYWTTRIVVGQPKTPTPLISDMISFITVNPTWNVPPSIIYNEYLPAQARDPGVLDRMGLKVTYNRDGSVRIYQPPGEKNALGRIRFNFPNKFLVYQHDTPDKHLFAHERRAYSHGCMRVQDPAKYGEVLLSLTQPHEGYTDDRLKKMFGTGEVQINLSVHVPVHLTYQTAFVDEHGKLQIREDIYGRDTRMIAALKTEDRRLADVPIERRETSYQRPRMPTGYGGSGFGFFENLFGGGPPRPPHGVGRRVAR